LSVLSVFYWCENTALGEAIRDSRWLFPAIESLHLLGLAVIGGAVLVVNLRLLGFGLRRQPSAQLWRDAHPWLLGSLAIMIATGLLLFTSEATKLYYHEAFWVKMISLALSIVFTFTAVRRAALADPARARPFWNRIVALVSLVLWSGVGIGGRWIGFS